MFDLVLLLARSADSVEMNYILGCFNLSVVLIFTTSVQSAVRCSGL